MYFWLLILYVRIVGTEKATRSVIFQTARVVLILKKFFCL